MAAENVVIVGIGESALGTVPGSSSLSLCADATVAALADSGLSKNDINGVITTDSYVRYHNRHAVQLAQYLGLSSGVRVADTMTGGSSVAGGLGVHYAAAMISGGLCDVVLVACGDNLKSAESRNSAVATMALNYEREFEVPYGPVVATRYAFTARRFMHERGTTREQLSAVAVSNREWAARNPRAQMQKRITIEDVTASKRISTPLHMLDCSLVSDGAGALLVMRQADAAARGLPYVRVRGMGSSHGVGTGMAHDSVSFQGSFVSYGSGHSLQPALDMSKLALSDVDLVYLYDCFSINVLVMLEDLGFCKKGEAGAFVAEGHTRPRGSLPVNTHGGLMSYVHPGKPGGIFMLTEAVRRLRAGTSDGIAKAPHVALVQGHGAHAGIHVTTLLSTH
jgi:acetyl-CoA acetyltransferase